MASRAHLPERFADRVGEPFNEFEASTWTGHQRAVSRIGGRPSSWRS